MRILVTGSAGFIGSWLSLALMDRGHDVLGLDDYSGGENQLCPQVEVDLRNRERTEEPVRYFHPEVLIHLAANAREGASQFQPFEVATRNLSAYASVLEASIAAGVRRVVLFSSMAVYGAQEPPFDEALEPRPVDVYGVCKASMERMTRILASVHGFGWSIVRPHNVFGPRQSMRDRFRNVVAIFMNRILRGEPMQIYGDGEQRRAFSYIENSLPCYVRLAEDPSLDGEVYNVGGSAHVSVNELATMVARAMSASGWPVEHLPPRPLEVKDAWCTWAKSVDRLGFQEPVSVEEGIRNMAGWAKSKGPHEWSEERLAIVNARTPTPWL